MKSAIWCFAMAAVNGAVIAVDTSSRVLPLSVAALIICFGIGIAIAVDDSKRR